MQFGTWLETTRVNAQNSGVDLRELATYAAKLTPYVQGQLFYARVGLEKLHIQLPPTPLSEKEQRERWEEHRERFIGDVRVVLDDIASVLIAVGCTDEELAAAGAVARSVTPVSDTEDETESDESSENDEAVEAADPDETVQVPILRIPGKLDIIKEK